MKNYKKLKVWQRGMELAKSTHSLVRQLPREEAHGLRSQMTRAAVSISSNIAEGSSRNSESEYRHFLEIALGSCFELDTQVIIAVQAGLLELPADSAFPEMLEEEIKMLPGFIARLKANSQKETCFNELKANSY